jgi:hypothetical protein
MSQENWDVVMYSEFTVWIIFFIAVAVIGGIEFAKYLRRSRRRATPPGRNVETKLLIDDDVESGQVDRLS